MRRTGRPRKGPLLAPAGAAVVLLLFFLLPVANFEQPLSTALLDADGRLMGAVTASDGQWRFGVPETVPEKYRAAVTLFEDKRFHRHPGIDPAALARAAWQDFRARRIVSGGSTLTMQVVRLSRPGRARTFGQKALEMVLALRLEAARSKEEILALYAGHAPFGGNVVGLDAAAWRYFGRPPVELSWAEAATLAVLPNNPALIHPGRNRRLLLEKRNRLLDRLLDNGDLSAEDCRLAKAEDLPGRPLPMPRLAPHLLDRARREARAGSSSAIVRTTLKSDVQRTANRLVEVHRRRLAANGIHNLAVLIAEVDGGEVLAYVGNCGDRDRGRHGAQVDVVVAPRSSGSILKPFLYAAMLEDGEILPDQLVADIPTRIAGFAPQNFDRTFAGAVPASLALSRSLNVPAVRMLRSYGIDRFYGLLRRLGVTTLFRPAGDYGLSLILGGAEVSLWETTALYAGLGRTINNFFLDRPDEPAFRPLTYRAEPAPTLGSTVEQPIGAGAVHAALEALLEVSRPGLDASWEAFASSRRVAWKTGTSFGYRDAWAIGLTPSFVVGVWAGNADGEGRPGLTGRQAAAPVLFDLFNTLPHEAFFDRPEAAMAEVDLCTASGLRAGLDCADWRTAVVPVASLPGRVCPYCRLVHLDASGSFRVNRDCESAAGLREERFFLLPPAMAWFYAPDHPEYRPLPPLRPDCRPDRTGRPITCISPQHGAEIYVPLELDGSRGRMVVEAAHSDPGATIFWHLDEVYIGRTVDEHRLALAPDEGEHVLTLVDSNGESLKRFFTVLRR